MAALEEIVEIGTRVIGAPPHLQVRLPDPVPPATDIRVDALWTIDGLRPTWDNLGLVAQAGLRGDAIETWVRRASKWPSRGVLLHSDGRIVMFTRSDREGLRRSEITWDMLEPQLQQWKKWFSPRGLARFEKGQLSLYHALPVGGPEVLDFLKRERARLEDSLAGALREGLKVARSRTNRTEPQDAITVAIAFVAARILEDKGFFGERTATNDPAELLRRTCNETNGFFEEAYKKALPNVAPGVLQAFAKYLGAKSNFSLVDHHDIGYLYEHLLSEIPGTVEMGVFRDLQSHYTPIALAEKMLQHLPVEQLRPTERIAFDPAAGSGTLLLAATSRLLDAPDVAVHPVVIGNDLNPTARLVTELRYTLAEQAYGGDRFRKPEAFTSHDYEKLARKQLKAQPGILIANPPFQEQGAEQRAARFITHALSWLEEGALFAVILPQSFLTASTHRLAEARKSVSDNCTLFEVWQYPEGVAGLTARQPICVLLGRVGKPTRRVVVARGVFSGAEVRAVRERGYIGPAWLAQVPPGKAQWSDAVFPPIRLTQDVVPLGALYHVFTGVTQRKGYPALPKRPTDTSAKRYWKTDWLEDGRIWADPERVDPRERWLRYDREALEALRAEEEEHFHQTKIFVGRVANRNSVRPLKAHLDTIGMCPNNNVYCIVPLSDPALDVKFVKEWKDLGRANQLYWLLGILSSETGTALSLAGRPTRNLPKDKLLRLPLPGKVDREIVSILAKWVARDIARQPVPDPDPFTRNLERLVRRAYGNPTLPPIVRTGVSSDYKAWTEEIEKDSFTVIGQVLGCDDSAALRLYLNAWDEGETGVTTPLPPELPGWTLDGTVFQAQVSRDVLSADQILERPWSLRDVRVLGRPYLSVEDLERRLAEQKLLS